MIEPMSDIPPELADLRRRIDEIDDRLQDLLTERVDLVSRVAASKRNRGGVASHQPGREAEIIRRLVRRNRSSLPAGTLVRMWRELLAATVRLQGPFTVAVYASPEAPGYWDLARDHYGSQTSMLAYRSTAQVIRAVSEGQAAIGVLPAPQEGELDPWWRYLLSSRDSAPHVVARLPFGPRGNARSEGIDAFAIGHGAPEQTGHDRTLLVTENTLDISRARIFSVLSGLGLTCTFMASFEQPDGGYTLIELDGFVALTDPRLDRFRTMLGPALVRLLTFGNYAVPLELGAGNTNRSTNAAQHPAALASAGSRG